jgi:hypothetical protein
MFRAFITAAAAVSLMTGAAMARDFSGARSPQEQALTPAADIDFWHSPRDEVDKDRAQNRRMMGRDRDLGFSIDHDRDTRRMHEGIGRDTDMPHVGDAGRPR